MGEPAIREEKKKKKNAGENIPQFFEGKKTDEKTARNRGRGLFGSLAPFPLPAKRLKKQAHLDLADAAGHEVEELLVLEVADGGAVRALDVVGDDFHGGHDGHAGLVADQESAAQLVRVRLLRDLLKEFRGPEGAD